MCVCVCVCVCVEGGGAFEYPVVDMRLSVLQSRTLRRGEVAHIGTETTFVQSKFVTILTFPVEYIPESWLRVVLPCV